MRIFEIAFSNLKTKKNRIQSESSRNQREMSNKVRGLINENQNLQSSLDLSLDLCKSPIVGKNGLSLLKDQSVIQVCRDYGIYDQPENSILIFDEDAADGNDERAIITQGFSTYSDNGGYGYQIGNKDRIITSFNINGNVEYQLIGACGVIHHGLIHFFGGWDSDYRNQHFGFDEKRNFVKYKNLEMDFDAPQCSTFKISKPDSQSGDKEVVLLCFGLYMYRRKNCYQYEDGELTHFADANERHALARLGKYKNQLITVGDNTYFGNQKTEILDRSYNGEYKWTLGPNYDFSGSSKFFDYSMVNVPQIGFNEEYLLVIGGQCSTYGSTFWELSDKVHKYNGKWSFFGNLQKTRSNHASVFLNGRVLIIGGVEHGNSEHGFVGFMKTETWDTSKSSFETETTWPELSGWWSSSNLAFIIPDYINP